MQQYNVTGMSCAACQARVEKAVKTVEGVSKCSVNLLTNSMNVEGTASSEKIIDAVVSAGYGAKIKQSNETNIKTDTEKNIEEIKMIKRLISSVILLLPLMYVSMGYMMWDFPIPGFMKDNHVAIGIYEMLLAIAVMVINRKFFINGFKGLIKRAPNMDTLVALGSMASFVYSLYAIVDKKEYYFESAAMILTLITVGKLLEERSKGKTTNALKALMDLAPKTALVKREDKEVEIPICDVKTGDRFIVKPGAQIPVDGIVIEGFSAVNESTFTGESVPVEKSVGDTVFTATINTNGYMICEATKIGEDTALAKVIQMVSDAGAGKAPIAKIADRVSGVFVPVVIAIAIITFVVWMLVGETLGFSLARAISVLVISCPCALGLATPVAIMVGNGVGAKQGVLFKTAETLEQTGKIEIVALDKTGTITTGIMKVTNIIPSADSDENELLKLAASVESKSEHPISKAIVEKAKEKDVFLEEADQFEAVAGNGLTATIDSKKIYGGNKEFIEKSISRKVDRLETEAKQLAGEGKTPIYFATDEKILGLIAVADTIKDDSKEAIEKLQRLGRRVVMLTGDNEVTANAIAKLAGIKEVIASVKPEGKAKAISNLLAQGKVAMVGDGVNDAPALTKADVGIAIGAGTDIAIDAADIVLMKNSLMDVANAITISKETIKNIHENLFWAFFYNVIGIPLAAGCYISAFGWTLNPMFGAAAMSLSSFCVVTNALRLNFIKLNEKNNKDNMEEDVMKITVKGMMCAKCEAHVKEALEKIGGIESAEANSKKNLVKINTSKDVSEEDIKKAVEEAGYEYVGIK